MAKNNSYHSGGTGTIIKKGISFQASNVFSNLAAGIYKLK
jgi:hypothetical protein